MSAASDSPPPQGPQGLTEMLIAEAVELAATPELRRLYEAAEEARTRSYAPYSDFRVGAALETANGEFITAGNVENASYGLTICAERAAVFRALAEGHRSFERIAVAGPTASVSPCGACRQVLAEFLGTEALVVFKLNGQPVAVPLGSLLPHAFGPADVRPGS